MGKTPGKVRRRLSCFFTSTLLRCEPSSLLAEAARPLVEVAQHDLGPRQLGAVEDPLVALAEPPSLVPPLHERGAEVDVEDVDGVLLAQEHVRVEGAPALAAGHADVVVLHHPDREPAEDHVP
jgi:hypothetical protein